MRTTKSFKLAIEIFSIRKTLISDNFKKLAFSLNKKFTDDVVFSHADTQTGCRSDANNIIKFRAYRRLVCCYPPRVSRETWVMSMVFSYVPGIHVIVFARSSSVARASASTSIWSSILYYTGRTKPSADT